VFADMKRVSVPIFLVAAALALAVAPSAFSSHVTEVTVQSATLGPGGSLTVSGTIDCTAGYFWFVSTTIRQKSGKTFNAGDGFAGGTCSTTGAEPWTTGFFFGQGPFKSGRAVAQSFGEVCDPEFSDCAFATETTEIRIRK
jgi:hypothetical protein